MRAMSFTVESPENVVPCPQGCDDDGGPAATNAVFARMGQIPSHWRQRLRDLSLGPIEGAMVRWSYHDGSTWAVVLFEGSERTPEAIIGWSVFTLQEDEHPIIGTFVDPAKRGRGYGAELVRKLLHECRDRVPAGIIYAVGDWWPLYPELIEEAGFEHDEWG
jgi:GNAT superfamily N-acetyltransferase